jgi:type VI secretion system secreted protein VgrG
MDDPFVLECSGLPAGARVVGVDGTEEISATYRYEIDLLVAPEADLRDAIGANATLTTRSNMGGDPGVVHGVIGSASVTEHLAEFDVYRVILVPRLIDVLGLDRHSRVFVDETVPGILQILLREAGFLHEDCDFRLSRTYEPIEFVCQYRESTLSFLMRWMERDGIYFYFSHDGPTDRLIIVDHKAQHPIPSVHAQYQTGRRLVGADGVYRFRAERHTVPGRVRVDDYDYLHPALPVRGEATVKGGNHGELRVRGAKVTTPKEANRIAVLRAEGLQARQTIFHGEGNVHGLHAGELFTLSGHPRPSLDGNYLVTKLRVRGNPLDVDESIRRALGSDDNRSEPLRVEFEAIWHDVQFRPELRTPIPRVSSMEGGVIEGDADTDYGQLDEHGRYYVKFRFDERDGVGSRASARVRMMQPHAGSPEGMHFPLRKGTEVVVAFLGGDPDRPVIAGAVPNALTPSVVRDDNATRNVILTGGGNRIQIEDAEGAQHIHLRSPHKNTYLHLGAPFNPSYTKTTATDGTSLSFTRDVSTSVTGTDAQTLVEDSRLTVIGRADIQPTDVAGVEVISLVGKSFLNQETGDFMWAELGSDVKQATSDMQALATAVEKLQTLVNAVGTAKAGTPLDMAAAVAAVQSALKTAFNDLTAVQADAERFLAFAKTSPDATLLPIANQWLTDVQAAVGQVGPANKSVNPKPPAAPPDPGTIVSTVMNTYPSIELALNLDNTNSTFTPTGNDPSPHGPPKLPTSQLPVLPNPSAGASYLTITHPPTQTTSMTDAADPSETIDKYIADQVANGGPPVQTNDPTAMDVLDTTAYPTATNSFSTAPAGGTQPAFPATTTPYALHPGSDVKIVGGDNVTLAARDARSHTEGHAYSLVHGGQTSVVYAYNKFPGSAPSVTPPPLPGLPPLPPPPLTRPTALPWAAQDTAQISTVYGNTRSWVDGFTDSTVTQDTNLLVMGNTTSHIQKNQTNTIDGTVHTTIHGDQHTTLADGSNNVTSEIHGTQNAYVLGSRSTEIVGNDFIFRLGGYESVMIGVDMNVKIAFSIAFQLGLKLTLATQMELMEHPLKSETVGTWIKEGAVKVGEFATEVLVAGMVLCGAELLAVP